MARRENARPIGFVRFFFSIGIDRFAGDPRCEVVWDTWLYQNARSRLPWMVSSVRLPVA